MGGKINNQKKREVDREHISLHGPHSQSLEGSDTDSKSFEKLLEMFQISLEKTQ